MLKHERQWSSVTCTPTVSAVRNQRDRGLHRPHTEQILQRHASGAVTAEAEAGYPVS